MSDSIAKPFSSVGPTAAAGIIAALLSDEPGAEDLPKIPGFTICELLGRGGSGAVYLAYRPGSQSRLAIKILAHHVSSSKSQRGLNEMASNLDTPGRAVQAEQGVAEPSGSTRAWRELDLLQQLRLPALPRLFEYGVHQGHLYIATEFVEGLPLDRHCKERQLDRRARVSLLADVADAVHSLHEYGVIHRDIKPANVLIDLQGKPMIIDLGIATLLVPDVMKTLAPDGTPIGSPAFMAPEQARGERDGLSTRADVYGLGASAYLILTGQTPHESIGGIYEMVRRVGANPARPARELEPSLPRSLAVVLEKAVSPLPGDRYASAAAFASDLRRWLRGEPVAAGGAGPWTRVMRWVSRHPRKASAIASSFFVVLSALTILVTLGFHFWYDRQPFEFFNIVDQSSGKPVGTRLETRSGRVLDRFGGPGCVLRCARMVDVPPELGGGRRAVLCVQADANVSARTTECQLWMCDPADLSKPVWQTDPTGPVVPPYPERYAANYAHDKAQFVFSVEAATIGDVFKENPGDEIVASLRSREGTAHAIRVYSLLPDGGQPKVLFECWHFGPVRQLVWWPEHQLLLGWGDRHGQLTHSWEAILDDPAYAGLYTHVVFAMKPVIGRQYGWIEDEAVPETKALVKWYRALGPVESARSFYPGLNLDGGGFGINGIQISFNMEKGGKATDGPSWYIDKNGDRIDGTVGAGDMWRNEFFKGDSGAAKQFVRETWDLREFPGWFLANQKTKKQ